MLHFFFPEPINSFQGSLQTDNEPIRISYHFGTHYNSLVDPYKATVGVGLGLPGYQPGLAENNLMKEATRQSENVVLEQVSVVKLDINLDFVLTWNTFALLIWNCSLLQPAFNC